MNAASSGSGRFQTGTNSTQRKISAESATTNYSSSSSRGAYGSNSGGNHLERRPIKYETQ